ncbi:hypothetical protein [Cognatiyoonia sp. IB215182]|uniref:hypothetical protein n=1 Tax=Cognatiyoonia sp. IB215182 TaxID=3097353 RepID=UPI002A16AA3E|nr:hypothetical protein [Cognatiyoonia sp. IB215182]MDX8350914.1 hypothetical protein [Cognatiyoonia sp. IB215182]
MAYPKNETATPPTGSIRRDGRKPRGQKTTVQVIANFKQVVKDWDLRMRSIVTHFVDAETLEKTGAQKSEPSYEKN